MLRSASLEIYKNRFIIRPDFKLQNYFTVSGLPVRSYESLEELVPHLPEVLADTRGREATRDIDGDALYRKVIKDTLKIAGFTSYREFSRHCKGISLTEAAPLLKIYPTRWEPPYNFMHMVPHEEAPLDDRPALIAAFQRAIARCEDSQQWYAKHPPRKRKKQ